MCVTLGGGFVRKQLKVVVKVGFFGKMSMCVCVLRHTDRYAEAGRVPQGEGV